MKKLTLSLVVAGLISTSAVASECSTLSEKIGFGAIGVLQGAIIGGPIGAFWGLGTIAFADKVNLCDSSEIKEITPIVNENKNLKQVQKIQEIQEVKQNENLNEIKTVINKEPIETYKEVNSFVNFEFNKYNFKITNTKISTLNMLNASKIQIEGHTDSIGSDEYNFALGLKRANSVKEYLIKNNIPNNILKIKSFGKTAPVSNIDSKNRRVDLKITYK